MELINTIVLLCQMNVGGMSIDIPKVRKEQIECQQYYVNCVAEKLDAKVEDKVKKCILERK